MVNFDKMKVRESLVYNKHSAQVIGFVQLGDNQLSEFEQDKMKHPPLCFRLFGKPLSVLNDWASK